MYHYSKLAPPNNFAGAACSPAIYFKTGTLKKGKKRS